MTAAGETVVDEQTQGNAQTVGSAARIGAIRGEIDRIDAAVIELLSRRFKATDEVGQLKALAGFAPADPERERAQVEHLRQLAQSEGLDPAIAQGYHTFVAGLAKERHARIAQEQQKAR
ncbi:chorismate mutase [Bombiscardovia nodaiensis]|uniref:Chorismate mutase n=1 Tax=Bombiscardovia nodaiensis TaxID=2932181 RepID=A0ABN6SDP5_9BIFI|nr:chorismate mutase [Bombiscardovia nodaiensis]